MVSMKALLDTKEKMGAEALKELKGIDKRTLERLYLSVKLMFHIRQFYKSTSNEVSLVHAAKALGFFEALSCLFDNEPPCDAEIRERLDVASILFSPPSAVLDTAQIEVSNILDCLVDDGVWFKEVEHEV